MSIATMPRIMKETSRGIDICALEDELFANQKIFLTEEVNTQTMNELLKQLICLEQQGRGREVTLYINSPGGECVSGLAVYDYIRMMKSPVRTVCTGTAASMAAILFLAGDKREMLPHTKIMIHDPAYGGGSMSGMKPEELENKLDDLKKIQKVLVDVIAERTGKTAKAVRAKTRTDSYFGMEEAMDFGLATGRYTED